MLLFLKMNNGNTLLKLNLFSPLYADDLHILECNMLIVSPPRVVPWFSDEISIWGLLIGKYLV
jgi:hypothetical protein